MQLITTVAPTGLVLLLLACGADKTTNPEPEDRRTTAVHILPLDSNFRVGDTVQLVAVLLDQFGDTIIGETVVWSTSTPGTIQLEQDGRIVGAEVGHGTVEASTGNIANTKDLKVSVPLWSISAGGGHTCGISDGDRAYCWGAGNSGQTGAGSTQNWFWPNPILSAERFVTIAAGVDHTCALTAVSRGFCWGANDEGQLGTTTNEHCGTSTIHDCATAPVLVSGNHRFSQISAWRTGVDEGWTCAIDVLGFAYCWGRNNPNPTKVSDSLTFQDITIGDGHACGVARTEIYCWGDGNWGQLGDGQATSSPSPVRVLTNTAFKSVDAGQLTSCGLSVAGEVWCWGGNLSGELGIGGGVRSADRPVKAIGTKTYSVLSVGWRHVCAVAIDNTAWCWGEGFQGALGDSSTTQRSIPTRVTGGIRFVQISAGRAHTCGIAAEGNAYCWGQGDLGRLGNAVTDRSYPGPIFGHPFSQ